MATDLTFAFECESFWSFRLLHSDATPLTCRRCPNRCIGVARRGANRFANAPESLCRSKLPRTGVCQCNALIRLSRRSPCPIVTFQTERKGIWDSLPPMAVEIDLRGGAPAACLLATLRRLQHGKPELRYCALGSAVRPGTDSGSRERRLSTAWVQTAAFLQQVPTTMELGPYRAGTAEFFWLLNWC